MLHAAIVRSPPAHARVVAIDASRALTAPGVVGVMTFADLSDAARSLPIVPPHAALAGKNFSLLAGGPAPGVGGARRGAGRRGGGGARGAGGAAGRARGRRRPG